jgi:hypothetical protein
MFLVRVSGIHKVHVLYLQKVADVVTLPSKCVHTIKSIVQPPAVTLLCSACYSIYYTSHLLRQDS